MVLVALVLTFHVWIVSAGRWTDWPSYGAHYDKLASGFLAGTLYLPESPRPELLALADPYDPGQNRAFRLHDALLYEGRYYFYWGPLPGLALVPIKFVRPATVIGDGYIVAAMDAMLIIAWTLVLVRLRERYYAACSIWVMVPPVLSVATVGMFTYALARPFVYEAAIIGGQAFLISAIFCVFEAASAERAKSRLRWLLAAGLCCGCAVACRSSLILAVSALIVLTAWRLPTTAQSAGRSRRPMLAMVLPVVLTTALLALYNYARFGSPTEFGLRYQLAGIHIRNLMGDLFSVRYILPNTHRALANGMVVGDTFPFVRPSGSAWIIVDSFIAEPMTGLLLTSPFLLFALVPPVVAFAARKAGLRGATPGASESWTVVTLAIVTVLSFLPAAAILASSPRYVIELAVPASLLAGVGFFQVVQRTRGRVAGGVLITLVAIAILYSAAVGFLMATQGEENHLRRHNPELFHQFSGDEAPPAPLENAEPID